MGLHRQLRRVALLLVVVGASQVGAGAYVHAKALAAQELLAIAWQRTRSGEAAVRPWPHADTWPVARLAVPRLGVERIVLDGASGRSLAFGPGHLPGTPLPGTGGNSVLAAHRDTHFAFLRALVPGDEVRVETATGPVRRYRVSGSEVVRADDPRVSAQDAGDRLTLVTCWPFDAVQPGTPWRYVVVAVPVQ
jgi:sortase A